MNACGSLAIVSNNSMSPWLAHLAPGCLRGVSPRVNRHQLLPQLLQPRGFLFVQLPLPFQRRRGRVVFLVLLGRFALIVAGGLFGGFLAFRQQSLDKGPTELDEQTQAVAFLIERPPRHHPFFLKILQNAEKYSEFWKISLPC